MTYPRFHHRLTELALVVPVLLAAAAPTAAAPHNFTSPAGPLYQGCDGPQVAVDAEPELRVVTFNIKFAIEIDKAIELLTDEADLRTADIVLLQEMDEPGVEKIGRALDMCWVYYPAVVHPQQKRDFGNAILSRLPLTDPRKIILPHLGHFGRTQRIATAATVEYMGESIRVYSLHVATQVELGAPLRREQALEVIEDAASSGAARVIIGGDLNDGSLGHVFAEHGFSWITRNVGKTCKLWSLDHVFVRGLSPLGNPGKIDDNRGASDHRPVWTLMNLPPITQPLTTSG